MGQYYTLTCPETGTYVSGRAMSGLVKAYEQIWSDAMPGMLAFLCSAGRGDRARDLPWAPQGLWAGRTPLMVGDYAENGDITGCPKRLVHPENELYERSTGDPVRLDARPTPRRARLKDLSTALMPIYERSHGMRSNGLHQDGTEARPVPPIVDFLPVKRKNTGWDLDLDAVDPEEKQQVVDFYTRIGAFKNTCWQRAPLDIHPDQHFTPSEDVPDIVPDTKPGAPMLWVNLDREEIIDPAAMGDTPDLVGVMRGLSARAVLASLVFHARRGGGDPGDLGPVAMAGRWRGDRIVLLGENPFRLPGGDCITQADARARFADVTANAQAFIEADKIIGADEITTAKPLRDALDPVERAILGTALQAPAARALASERDPGAFSVRIFPPVRIKPDIRGRAAVDLAGSADLYFGEGKVFLPAEVRGRINTLIATLPRKEILLERKREGHCRSVSADLSSGALYSPHSNHELIAIIGQAG